MKKNVFLWLFCFVLLAMVSCKPSNNKNTRENPQEEIKNEELNDINQVVTEDSETNSTRLESNRDIDPNLNIAGSSVSKEDKKIDKQEWKAPFMNFLKEGELMDAIIDTWSGLSAIFYDVYVVNDLPLLFIYTPLGPSVFTFEDGEVVEFADFTFGHRSSSKELRFYPEDSIFYQIEIKDYGEEDQEIYEFIYALKNNEIVLLYENNYNNYGKYISEEWMEITKEEYFALKDKFIKKEYIDFYEQRRSLDWGDEESVEKALHFIKNYEIQ